MLGHPNQRTASPDLGFKRIWAVRVCLAAGATRYEVDGVVHRRPVTRTVTPRMAARLAAAGVPVVIRNQDAEPRAASC